MSDFDELNTGLHWYVAHTYSGYENKVKANLEKIIENRGLQHLISDICIPVETITEADGDKEREVESKVFPSYVLIKMVMTDESWHVVRNIRGVTGFVGPGSRPTPLTDEEVASMNIETRTVNIRFAVGDTVRITGGLFEGYEGTVQEIPEDFKEVTVLVRAGTRDMPVKLESKFVQKKD